MDSAALLDRGSSISSSGPSDIPTCEGGRARVREGGRRIREDEKWTVMMIVVRDDEHIHHNPHTLKLGDDGDDGGEVR
jgi:hypothetical protein